MNKTYTWRQRNTPYKGTLLIKVCVFILSIEDTPFPPPLQFTKQRSPQHRSLLPATPVAVMSLSPKHTTMCQVA